MISPLTFDYKSMSRVYSYNEWFVRRCHLC